MITNLFSSFDPSTFTKFRLNWLRSLIIFLIIPPIFWLIPSRWNTLWNWLINTLYKEFKILIKSSSSLGRRLIFIRLFNLILLNNFIGLFPYIFTSSRHIRFSLTISLPLWLSFILYGWINNTTHIFAHLVPQGAPTPLLPFLVLIETTSNLIRPGALAIRLTANIIAGHLLLTLLGNSGPTLNLWIINILLFVQFLFLLLEFAVSIIQSYVFSILTTLYSREVTN